jgi:hypothetical protein
MLGKSLVNEYKPHFESKIHQQLGKQVDDEIYSGNVQVVRNDIFPKEISNKIMVRRTTHEEKAVLSKELQVVANNKIGRTPQHDHRSQKVAPLVSQSTGIKVQANTKAIHSKLFS